MSSPTSLTLVSTRWPTTPGEHASTTTRYQLTLSHFGINQFFLDNGLDDAYETKLYFPADCVSRPYLSARNALLIFRLK
jgi:hypothetical protein